MMLKNLFVFLSIAPILVAGQFELERGDGSKLVAFYETPNSDTFSITWVIPGSQKESSKRTHDSLKQEICEKGFCALTLEKQGIVEGEVNDKEFSNTLSLGNRLEDHLLVLKHLHKGLISGWDGKIHVIGQGDGGRIGAALAAKSGEVAALVLIASGGAWPSRDEALYSFRSELVEQGYSPQYIHGFLVQAKQQFDQALTTPKPEHKAFGYTYKYWESLLKSSLFDDLASVNCPIYSINGVNDTRVPIESVDVLAKKLEDKMTLNRKETAGREIIQDPSTYEEAILWLENHR